MQTEYKPLDRETARRAHLGTSFSPERRGEQEIQSHKETFEELQKELGDFFTQDKADKLHSLWTDYLHSHSAVMSTMITGPANFPTARNRKRSDWADTKSQAITEYCNNLKKWKGKADRREYVEAAGGELALKKAELEASQAWHATMKAANKIIKAALKNGGITAETKTAIIAAGIDPNKAEDITNPPDRLKCYGYGFPSSSLTNSNARIKNQAARVAELERIEAAKDSGVEAETVEIPGGVVIVDKAENRINVKHDEKPSRDIIDIIKSHGFHWSRSYGHWTRQITSNAMYSTRSMIAELKAKEQAAV